MRILQLDLLRCLAVLLVLGRHLVPYPESQGPWLHAATAAWQRGGWIGVDLFFVLSGFLVSGLLFREYQRTGGVRAGHFLIRRGWKIYPAFWLLLALTLLLGNPVRETSLENVLGELLFLQNYLGRLWKHTWSLAVEEHFYFLLAGWVAWRCRRRPAAPFDGLPALFAGVAVVCLALRAATSAWLPYSHATHLFPTHLRIDSLLFGVLLAWGWHFRGLDTHPRLSRHPWLLALAGLPLLLPPFFLPVETTPWMSVVGLSGIYLGGGLLLLAMLYVDEARFRPLAWLARLGTYSYSIYLCHMAVARWLVPWVYRQRAEPLDWFVYAALYLGGCLVVGVALAKLVEVPALRLRDRLYPSRSGALRAEVPGAAVPGAPPAR